MRNLGQNWEKYGLHELDGIMMQKMYLLRSL